MELNDHPADPHVHVTETGALVKCYHHCKNILTSVPFWIGMTLGFPVEHFLWTQVPPFSWLAQYVGLIPH